MAALGSTMERSRKSRLSLFVTGQVRTNDLALAVQLWQLPQTVVKKLFSTRRIARRVLKHSGNRVNPILFLARCLPDRAPIDLSLDAISESEYRRSRSIDLERHFGTRDLLRFNAPQHVERPFLAARKTNSAVGRTP